MTPWVARGETPYMPDGVGNAILNALDPRELALLQPHLQEVTLEGGSVIAEAGQLAEFVYFPTIAVLSLVGTTESGASVGVAVVGCEGMASVSAILGSNRLTFRVMVQLGGTALRVRTATVTRLLKECGDLHQRLLEYSLVVIGQVGQSAICNRFHNAKQRLARWLLMTMDRAHTRELPLTHEFLSCMVGGPRSAVTEAAAALRDCGAIDYRRGKVTVLSLPRLRQQACECYDAVRTQPPDTPQ
jgi:CRP-like cAMP-binding protein